MKENNKKALMVMGVLLFLVGLIVSVGITSAYFLVDVKNNITKATTITATLGKNAKAILSQEEVAKNLRLNIEASDMTLAKAIKEVEYYADSSKDYVTTQAEGMKKLATLTIQDSEEGIAYKCNAKIKVAKKEGSTNNMLGVLKEGDIELYLRGGDLIIKEDVSKIASDIDNGGKEYNINYIIEGNGREDLMGYIKLNNRSDASQNHIAGKGLNIEIKAEEISCGVLIENDTIKTLRSKANGTLSTKLTGGMYRYQGSNEQVLNNYVCLGSDCSKDTDKMYRIIGVTADGEMKLIKKEALEKTYQWYTNYNEDIEWPKSKIYEAISGTDFLNNSNYIPEGWQSKIKDTNWIYGGMFGNNNNGAKQTGPELYKTEMGLKLTQWNVKSTEEAGGTLQKTIEETDHPIGTEFYYKTKNEYWTNYINSKVGLINLSDYYLSVSDTANCESSGGAEKYEICKQGWLHLLNNDSAPKAQHEWTITPYGWYTSGGVFNVFVVHAAGYSTGSVLTSGMSTRPVFYLSSQVSITGEGTIGSPFIIN